jgi:transposase
LPEISEISDIIFKVKAGEGKMALVVNSLEKVAAHFGRSRRTAQRWARAGMPKGAAGWEIYQVAAWLKASKFKGGLGRLEEEAQIRDLLEVAVHQLRQGLEQLCRAYARARGGQRQALIDQVVRDLLHDHRLQASLQEADR